MEILIRKRCVKNKLVWGLNVADGIMHQTVRATAALFDSSQAQ